MIKELIIFVLGLFVGFVSGFLIRGRLEEGQELKQKMEEQPKREPL